MVQRRGLIFGTGLVLGAVLSTVFNALLVDHMDAMKTRMLEAPALLCVDNLERCATQTAVGTLSPGVVLDVDSKGFARLAVRVEPGLPPGSISEAPVNLATRLRAAPKR